MSKALVAKARKGDVDGLLALAENETDGEVELYRWLLVAADFGSEEAEELADTLHSTAFKHTDDEGVAMLHFEVGRWWLFGEEGLKANAENGIAQMERAKELGLKLRATDPEYKRVRAKLTGATLKDFDRLFSKPAAKKAATKQAAAKKAKAKVPARKRAKK